MKLFNIFFLCGLVIFLEACALQVPVRKFVVDVPNGWQVSENEADGFIASPSDDMGLPILTVQSCDRAEPRCVTPCVTENIRENFFYFALSTSRFEFAEKLQPDGSVVYTGYGTVAEKDGTAQIAGGVICSTSGIVFLSLSSNESIDSVRQQFEKMLLTVRRAR